MTRFVVKGNYEYFTVLMVYEGVLRCPVNGMDVDILCIHQDQPYVLVFEILNYATCISHLIPTVTEIKVIVWQNACRKARKFDACTFDTTNK